MKEDQNTAEKQWQSMLLEILKNDKPNSKKRKGLTSGSTTHRCS
jgi:hypothetical protein